MRDDVIIDGEVIQDYMSSLEYMTPAQRKHFKAKLEIEGFKPKRYYQKKEEEPLKTQIKYDGKLIFALLDSLDDEVVDMFLEGMSFVAGTKQTFSYDYDVNVPIINAMLFHISFTKQTAANESSLRELFKELLSNNYIVDKMNNLLRLLS